MPSLCKLQSEKNGCYSSYWGCVVCMDSSLFFDSKFVASKYSLSFTMYAFKLPTATFADLPSCDSRSRSPCTSIFLDVPLASNCSLYNLGDTADYNKCQCIISLYWVSI